MSGNGWESAENGWEWAAKQVGMSANRWEWVLVDGSGWDCVFFSLYVFILFSQILHMKYLVTVTFYLICQCLIIKSLII